MNKYYIPRPKVEIKCKKCDKVFLGMASQQFCSNKCRSQFNEKKFRERQWTQYHSREIWKILSDKCASCGKESNQIHHKTYDISIRKVNLARRNVTKEDLIKMLKEYCKYLQPLCTSCHRKKHE